MTGQVLYFTDYMTQGQTDDQALTAALADMTAQRKDLYIPGGIGTSTINGLPALKITTPNHVWKS